MGYDDDDVSDSDDEVEQLQYKIIILGDGAVGKTSIAQMFTNQEFSNVYKQTIGLDFFLRKIQLPDNVQVTLQVWDIGGQTIGGKMLQNYIYGAQAVVLVYDITNYESFQNLEDWFRLVRRTFKNDIMPHVVLVGNKADLKHLEAVPQNKHVQFAEENDMKTSFCSAKTGDDVDKTFIQLAADLAGVILKQSELDSTTRIVTAQIVDHEQNDETVQAPDIRKKNGCLLQ